MLFEQSIVCFLSQTGIQLLTGKLRLLTSPLNVLHLHLTVAKLVPKKTGSQKRTHRGTALVSLSLGSLRQLPLHSGGRGWGVRQGSHLPSSERFAPGCRLPTLLGDIA